MNEQQLLVIAMGNLSSDCQAGYRPMSENQHQKRSGFRVRPLSFSAGALAIIPLYAFKPEPSDFQIFQGCSKSPDQNNLTKQYLVGLIFVPFWAKYWWFHDIK